MNRPAALIPLYNEAEFSIPDDKNRFLYGNADYLTS